MSLKIRLLIVVVGVVIITAWPKSKPPEDKVAPPCNPCRTLEQLDAFSVYSIAKHVYSSYDRRGDEVDVHLNPSLWKSLTRQQQRQLCHVLSNGTFVDAMGLTTARLDVNGTPVGRIFLDRSGSMTGHPGLQFFG